MRKSGLIYFIPGLVLGILSLSLIALEAFSPAGGFVGIFGLLVGSALALPLLLLGGLILWWRAPSRSPSGQCPQCEYDLRKLPRLRCPECGWQPTKRKARRRRGAEVE